MPDTTPPKPLTVASCPHHTPLDQPCDACGPTETVYLRRERHLCGACGRPAQRFRCGRCAKVARKARRAKPWTLTAPRCSFCDVVGHYIQRCSVYRERRRARVRKAMA